MLTESERVQLTISCRDTDSIPKVDDAGAVQASPHGPVQVMHNGVLVAEGLYGGPWMTDIIRGLRGHHEPQEEVVFDQIVERLAAENPQPTMLELGSFWAYYSLWMLQRLPDARVILVEPDPNNLEVGRSNLALNRRQAEMIQAAVGSRATPPLPFLCESDRQTRPVPTESLQSLLTRFDVAHLDLLFLDVQGAEWAFLDGGRDLLAERVRFVMVSTHHQLISGDPSTHQRCLQLLTDLGAHIVAEHTVAESFSGDGLIAASFDRRDEQFRVPVSYCRAGESLFGDPVVDLAQAHAERGALSERLVVVDADRSAISERLDAVDADRNAISERLVAAVAELGAARTDTMDARVERENALAVTARLATELDQMKSSETWRAHERLLGSRIGRAALRGARRAARALSSAPGARG